MLETQIVQKATFSSTPLDRLPSELELNPREQCNAMLLQGGKQLEGPEEITHDESSQDKNKHVDNVEKEISSPSKEIIDDVARKPDEVPKYPKAISLKSYIPTLPFPQRMAKENLIWNFESF